MEIHPELHRFINHIRRKEHSRASFKKAAIFPVNVCFIKNFSQVTMTLHPDCLAANRHVNTLLAIWLSFAIVFGLLLASIWLFLIPIGWVVITVVTFVISFPIFLRSRRPRHQKLHWEHCIQEERPTSCRMCNCRAEKTCNTHIAQTVIGKFWNSLLIQDTRKRLLMFCFKRGVEEGWSMPYFVEPAKGELDGDSWFQ